MLKALRAGRVDRLGRPYTPMMLPELRRGQHPPNYGNTYPAEVLSPDEVRRLLAACSRRGNAGLRNRAIIVVLWRCGLRISEALALQLRDVDLDAGTVTVRHGKGNLRRVVGIDPQAGAVVAEWARRRAELGVGRGGPLFCTITSGNVGAPVQAPYFREALKALAARAGIDKRVHPHGLRHTHAVELMREGVPVPMIQRQLGHADLATTARYLDHLLPHEVIERMQARRWSAERRDDGQLVGQVSIDELLA